MTRLLPRTSVPELVVARVEGDEWSLAASRPTEFLMIAFYRGSHCPICRGWLGSLQKHLADFASRDVEVLAVSMDSQERAARSKTQWGIPDLSLGYGLTREDVARWGLFLSSGKPGSEEPAVFSEPGLFLMRPNRRLYFSTVQTMPFTRPAFAEVVQAVDYAVKNDFPAHGELEP